MLRDGAVTWCVATNGQGCIWLELSQFKLCFSSSWLSVMVISSLRVAEEREREIERERERSGFHVAFPNSGAVTCRCGGLSSSCGRSARACESGSSNVAVGLHIRDRNMRSCSSEGLDISLCDPLAQ